MHKKTLKFVLGVVLVIIFIDVCILQYIKINFIQNNSNIKISIINTYNKTFKDFTDAMLSSGKSIIHLPKNARGIKISQTNNFAAYIFKNKLFVLNLINLKKYSIPCELYNVTLINKELTSKPFYNWIPDRDILSIGYSKYSKKKTKYKTVHILFYNAKNNKTTTVLDFDHIQENRYITSINVSPITNVTYFKIDGNNDISSIYRIGQNKNVTIIKNSSFYTKEMFLLNSQDKLFFNGVNPDGIYSMDAKSLKNSRFTENNKPSYFLERDYTTHKILNDYNSMKILSITKNDKIIIGHYLDNYTINKLYSYDFVLDKLTPINLNIEKIKNNNLFISVDGNIYLLYQGTNRLLNINSKKEIYYKGSLLQISKGYISSIFKNTLFIKRIK